MAHFASPWEHTRIGSRMNRRRVIVVMTAAMFFGLIVPISAMFGGLPPWPIIVWLAVSHIFFCVVIASTKPFRGPYTKPYVDPPLPRVLD
jgi:hypothetical protein